MRSLATAILLVIAASSAAAATKYTVTLFQNREFGGGTLLDNVTSGKCVDAPDGWETGSLREAIFQPIRRQPRVSESCSIVLSTFTLSG